jgi:phosphohistidine phosphatase
MENESVRRLIVARHAKAAWPEGVPDLQRPLAERGRRDAPRAGRWLAGSGLVPDRVICSPAARTRETFALISSAWDSAPPVDYDERVYAAGISALLAVVRGAPPTARALMVVGHNPGMQGLTLALAGDGDPEALARAQEKYPTCAIAVLEIPGTWSSVGPGSAVLDRFVVPREFG